VADGDGLENHCGGNVTVGSNPTPSAQPGTTALYLVYTLPSAVKDGVRRRLVAWIAAGTSAGLTITAAIPPVFQAYATIVRPDSDEGQAAHDRAVLALLTERSAAQPWWLGYLDTGTDDVVFPRAPL
jgi:hypothetical protein